MDVQTRTLGQVPKRVTGTSASVIKYDILTALLVTAAQGEPVAARLSLRLSLVVTARFNWRLGTFSVGLRELARMWGVTERTAKRDIAAMRTRAWIEVHKAAVRGRVAEYRINIPVVLNETSRNWDAIGPDFVERMTKTDTNPAETAANVVPLRRDPFPVSDEDNTGWAQAAHRLKQQDPAIYSAWFAPLQALEFEAGILTMMAPTRFHADYVRTHFSSRLQAVLAAENRAIRAVNVIGPQDGTGGRL